MTSEPYGTTPLPAKCVSIQYDPVNVWDVAQQPKSQQIAVYEGSKNEDSINGATILDVNQHFVIYAVKKGLIRILHRHSTLRTLFRGHAGKTVTDIRFFLDGDVLGSVATGDGSSSVIIWRVFERTPEIMSEKLLEISTANFTISRLIWHPFNPNQFWMIHTNSNNNDGKRVASLVETTRITTLPHETEGHAVCRFHTPNIIMDGAMQLASPEASSLVDLDWSEKDVRHVLTAHQGGEIRLCDLRKVETMTDGTLKPACLCLIQEDQPLSRCRFLPHECPRDQPSQREKAYTTCFLTAANENSTVTLWSPFREGSTPTKLQVFGVENPSPSYLLDICYGPGPPEGPPPSLFVLLADQNEGKLFAWHLESEWQVQTVVSLVGCDYVVPFQATYPMYSWSTKVAPAADISEDELTDQGGLIFDMKLFSYQSSVVQCLTLTSFMCLPPENQWSESTPGVRVEELQHQEMGAASEIAMSEDFDGEEYDIGDDEDAYSEPPEASALPPPDGLDSPAAAAPVADPVAASGNPFANWLGAIAGKTMGAAPPPPMPLAEAAGVGEPSPMLTPADIVGGTPASSNATSTNPSPMPQHPDSASYSQNQNKKKKNSKSRSRSPRGERGKQKNSNDNGGKTAQQQPMAILKREADQAAAVAAPAPPMAVASVNVVQPQSNVVSGTALSELFRQQEAMISKEIQRVMQAELNSTVVPMIDQKVRECVTKSVEPVLLTLNSLGKDGVQVDNDKLANVVASKVEDPLRAAFAENMKSVLIPAFESVSAQMFAQISSSLENGMAQREAAATRELQEVKNQLSNMFSLVQQLSSEVQSLRAVVSEQGVRGRVEAAAPRAPPAPSMVDQKQAMEQEVMTLLGQRQYEAAFTKALSASTVEIALFVCKNADLPDVLGGTSPALSQPILLCLMHQLGTSVVTADNENNLQLELAWLQEISLSINPADESMRRHLPGVLQQLVNGINTKMSQNPAMRRPLQRLLQVLRGMQV